MIDMQGGGGEGIWLELTTTSTLEIDAVDELPADKIRRLITEIPTVIFSRSSCHVMKTLLSTLRAHLILIELEDHEFAALPPPPEQPDPAKPSPTLFVGGSRVGGLESLVALHLSVLLIPKLKQAGALCV